MLDFVEVDAMRAQRGVVWLYDVRENGTLTYRMGRRGDSLVAEWPRLARLTCRRDGTGARLRYQSGASPRSIGKLRGVANALMTDLRGGLGVHASAVAVAGKGALILGQGGAGKSTAAAALCLRHRAGLLADDAAVLMEDRGVVHILPSETRHWLTLESSSALGLGFADEEAVDGKAEVDAARVTRRAARLALVVLLRFDDEVDRVSKRPLTGFEAAHAVLGAMYRFDLRDRRRELDRVRRLYEQSVFLEFSRPRTRPDVTSEILRALETCP